ncbi:MAG: TetR/AcrR family transcriptional regulator [Clostridiales bacterium]|nr:TetR/AcrR family transcriptional regulator [Clostridiales bacterium]
MSAVEEKKQQKRLSILDAAFNLFSDKSVHTTAIDEVVKRAGVAKGTFYLYFKDKYDLLDAIIVRKTTAIVRAAFDKLEEERKDREMTLKSQTVFFIDRIIDALKENKGLVALIDKNMAACFRAFAKIDDEDIVRSVKELLETYISKGYSTDEAKKMLYITMDMVGSACCDAILNENPYSIEEIRPTIHIMVEKLFS